MTPRYKCGHPHSSQKTAATCWGKLLGKRADRKLHASGAAYREYRYFPGASHVKKIGRLEIFYFYHGELQ